MKKLVIAICLLMTQQLWAVDCTLAIGFEKATSKSLLKVDCGGAPSITEYPDLETVVSVERQLATAWALSSGWRVKGCRSTPAETFYYTCNYGPIQ